MDPGSKNKGGNLGWVKRGSLLKEFEEKTFTIKINNISEPIETDVGFHILEVFERKGDKARVRHILISPQIEKSDEERAFNFSKTLKDSCTDLTSFKNFAKKHSKDYQTSNIGGDLGWIIPDQYPIKEFGLALNYIKKGECSPPINTSYGFHLLWLEKIKTGGRANIKDHWPKIEEMASHNQKRIIEIQSKTQTNAIDIMKNSVQISERRERINDLQEKVNENQNSVAEMISIKIKN